MIRSPSTKFSACRLQSPTASFSSTSYAVSSTALDTTLPAITHCQGAEVTITTSVADETSLPAWIEASGATLKIKPSQIKTVSSLKSFTVNVEMSALSTIPTTSNVNFQPTFTNTPPAATETPLIEQTMYQGMGAHKFTLPIQLFTDSDTITLSVSNDLVGVTPKKFFITGNILEVEIPDTYKGTFAVTITGADYVGQTATTSFNILVQACTQPNCIGCKGTKANECII